MKRKFLMLTALLISAVSTFADDMFTVTTAGIPEGAKGTIAIGLPAGNTTTYVAFQITLTLPTGLKLESAVAKGDLLTATHSIDDSVDGTTVKITSAATTTTNFTGTSGTLCVLTVSAEAGANTGNLTIKSGAENTVLTYENNDQTAQNVLESDEPHAVTVTDGVVLDENSTVLPASQNGVAFTLKRTLIGGAWNTICLPFKLSKDKATALFGENICRFKSVNTNGNTITVNFEKLDWEEYSFDANTPFIVKPAATISTIEFTAADNISIDPNEASAVVTKSGGNKFIGTLRAGITIPADYIFLGAGDNKFYYSEGSTTIKAFRGYFWLKDFSSSAGARQLNLVVDGEDATGIEGLYINGEPVVKGVYNLKGQRVDTPTQKGIYIKDGKKVVIK